MLQNYMSALNPKNHEKKPSSSPKFKKEVNSLCSQSAMNFLLFLPKSNCWNLVLLSSVHFLDFADFYSFFSPFSRCLKITEKISSTLRAKLATFTFKWTKVDHNAKNGLFGRVFENLKLWVKQCYQTGQV